MLAYIALFSSAAAAAFVLRIGYLSLYLNWFVQGPAGDAAYHLCAIRQIRSGGPFRGVTRFLLTEEPDAYPILFHRLCALYPGALIERHPYLPNLVIWTLAAGGVTAYGGYASVLYGLRPDVAGYSFLILFLTLASNVSSDMNGLNYLSLSERLLARIASAFFFVAMATAVDTGDMISFGVAVAAGTMAGITSLFGRQTVYFTTPLVSLLTWSPLPLEILVLAFLGALVVDRGYFLRGIRQQVRYSIAYNLFTKRSPYYQGGLSRFVNVRMLLRRSRGIAWRLSEMELHEPTRVIFRYPELLALGALMVVNQQWQIGAAGSIILATLILYILTTFKALRHLGEANRYLEYNLWYLAPLILAREWCVGAAPTYLVVGYFLWIGLVTVWKLRSWRSIAASFPVRDVLSEFLSEANIKSADVVFPVPIPLGAAICARVDCKAIMYQGVAVSANLYAKYVRQPPYLNGDWRPVAAAFGATIIVADKSMVDASRGLMGWSYDFSGQRLIAESTRYAAYEILPAVT